MTLAAALVDWSALGRVVLYSILAGVGVPALYSFAVLGAARSTEAGRARRGLAATAYALLAFVGAGVCLGAMAFGIWLMTQKS